MYRSKDYMKVKTILTNRGQLACCCCSRRAIVAVELDEEALLAR